MPIHEEVLDGLAHVMGHYFTDYPEEDGVNAEELATYMEDHGVCAHCVQGFLEATGGEDLADAIAVVWESELWQAFRDRLTGEGDDHG